MSSPHARVSRHISTIVGAATSAWAAGLMLAACPSSGGGLTPTAQPQDAPATEPAPVADVVADPTPPPVAAPPTKADLTVVEWGLLEFKANAAELVTAPTRPATAPAVSADPLQVIDIPPPHPAARKPVVYLRPGPTWDPATPVAVTVTMSGTGYLHEVWPTPANGPQPEHGTRFVWQVGGIQKGACAPGWGPTLAAPACASLPKPADCEAALFETWVPNAPFCLDVSGTPAPALLYNGFPADDVPPLIEHKAGAWKNRSAHVLPVVFVRDGDTIHRKDAVAPGAEVMVPSAAGAGPADDTRVTDQWLGVVSAELRRQGLGEAETQDFMRAWGDALGGQDWQVFGFLGADGIAWVSTLAVKPEPTSTTRVMAFLIAR